MKLTNLTPHSLTLRDARGTDTVLLPSGTVARVASAPGSAIEDALFGCPVPVYSPPTLGEVEGLPAPAYGTLFIVSGMVAQALRDRGIRRGDVVSPGTGPADNPVRNEAGQIVAVTRLIASA